MKIALDKDKLGIRIIAEDELDLIAADKIERMIGSEEWRVLTECMANVREAYLESIKNITSSDASAKMSQIKAGAFKGFDECLSVPGKMLVAAQTLRGQKNKQLEDDLNDEVEE